MVQTIKLGRRDHGRHCLRRHNQTSFVDEVKPTSLVNRNHMCSFAKDPRSIVWWCCCCWSDAMRSLQLGTQQMHASQYGRMNTSLPYVAVEYIHIYDTVCQEIRALSSVLGLRNAASVCPSAPALKPVESLLIGRSPLDSRSRSDVSKELPSKPAVAITTTPLYIPLHHHLRTLRRRSSPPLPSDSRSSTFCGHVQAAHPPRVHPRRPFFRLPECPGSSLNSTQHNPSSAAHMAKTWLRD